MNKLKGEYLIQEVINNNFVELLTAGAEFPQVADITAC
jgi:hypothetical protein